MYKFCESLSLSREEYVKKDWSKETIKNQYNRNTIYRKETIVAENQWTDCAETIFASGTENMRARAS